MVQALVKGLAGVNWSRLDLNLLIKGPIDPKVDRSHVCGKDEMGNTQSWVNKGKAKASEGHDTATWETRVDKGWVKEIIT